jgi:5-methylcytosine-specific restriction endonuclease McrA
MQTHKPLNRPDVCSECKRIRPIVNRKHLLCPVCNKKRTAQANPKSPDFKPLKGKGWVNTPADGEKHGKSPKNRVKWKPKSTGERELFLFIWETRPHYCVNCLANLGDEPRTFYFSHIKGKGAHPDQRLNQNNIQLLCFECHRAYDAGTKEQFEKRRYNR